MNPEGSYKKLGAENLKRIEQYVRRIEALLSKATGRFIDLSTSVNYDREDGQFYFSDYPQLKREVEYIVNTLATDLNAVIMAGTTNEWKRGSKDAGSLLDYVLESTGAKTSEDLKGELAQQLLSNHDSALKAFQKRQIGGMNLSSKVWDLSNKTKIETELARSIADGTSAQELAESMQEYLKKPNELYRRVRDEFGNLHLSKRAKAYHPEEGAYRSSYKNALRLARTEINMSYRNAEQESWQDQDYVVGIQIHRSQTAYDCDVCASLEGKYPKDFKWNGWHPNCRCYMTPILLTQEEREKWTDAVLEGEEYDCTQSENYVGDVPKEFQEWVDDNTARIAGAYERGTLPYFVRDNMDYVAPEMFENGGASLDWLEGVIRDKGQMSLTDIQMAIGAKMDIITEDIFDLGDAGWVAKRKALHEQIIEKYVAGNTSKSDTVYMLGGAPANGKSTLVDSGLLKHPTGSLVIDADKVKAMIPEYAAMVKSGDPKLLEAAANFVHEESSMLGKAIQQRALKAGNSVVIDGVNDGSFEKVKKNVERIKRLSDGKRVRADYVTLDTDLSLKLAEARAKKTGRNVRKEIILNGNKGIAEMFPQLVENKTFDELYLWDTNINGKPRLILKQIDGKTEIFDEKLYADFLKKAKYKAK